MPKKILLADDSITIQKVIGLTFANEDFELTVVDNGDDCVAKAREVIPDLIIADVVMPGKDGYEVCYTVKNTPELKHIPVLLLTGTFETFDEDMATRVGAEGHITKPFESQSLIDKVNELIVAAEASAAGTADSFDDAPAETLVADDAGLDPVEPVEPMEELEPVDAIEPLDTLEPMEPMESMEPVEPVEDFSHVSSDPEETSFADVSLDDAPAEPVAIDEPLEEPEAVSPEPSPFDEPVPEPFDEPMGEAFDEPEPQSFDAADEDAAEAATPPAASAAGDWNVNDFNDFMAGSNGPAAVAAPADAEDLPAPVQEESFAMDDDLPASAEPEALPETLEEDPQEMEPTADDLPMPLDADAGSDLPVPLSADDDLPVAMEEVEELSTESTDFDDLPAPLDEPALDLAQPAEPEAEELMEESAADDPTELMSAGEPASGSSDWDSAPADEELGGTPADVDTLYGLDDDMAAEPPAEPAPPASVAVQPAGVSTVSMAEVEKLLEARLNRFAEDLDSRLRTLLADESLLQPAAAKTVEAIEHRLASAVQKAAPEMVERVVSQALTGTMERVLTELLGKVRNG